jgi:molecular chaperone HtpG
MTVEAHKETLGFQAEVVQLLDLMIHSLYSNKEIFLRELISNASDAADKLRFEAISTEALFEEDTDLRIVVSYDKEARTISVSDNGIGMSRQEVIDNIGTIAKSGTRDFFKALSGDQQKDAHLIGQFGVGFYSSFIVADKVTLATRRAGLPADAGVQWESDGQGAYSLETIEKPDRGTTVTLHLREGEDELLSGYRLRTIIRKYSDHISLPILMKSETPPAEGEEAAPELETVNRASALWTRSKSEITEEEYTEFYKHVAHEFTEPLAYVHSKMEGKYEYTILLYIPAHAPFDLWNRDSRHGVKLYVRRVFIMDDAEQLLPNYLRFVRGIVDSSDLPLNVSREILQHSRVIDSIKSGSVKKILGLLKELATDKPEKYATFWKEFGTALKEGIAEDSANRDELARLLRFSTTAAPSETQEVSLETYVGRMKDGQDKIYYLVADNFAAAKSSPLLEIFKKKGVEVILLSDPIDNWVVAHLTEFDGKQLQSVARGEVDLGKVGEESGESEEEKPVEDSKDLVERMKSALGERVKEVRVTSRLTTSPACLVVDERGIDPTFVRLMKAAGQPVPDTQPIFEVNPRHPIVTRLAGEADNARFGDWTQLLFDQAVLSEGGQLEDPAAFVTRLNDLLVTLGTN